MTVLLAFVNAVVCELDNQNCDPFCMPCDSSYRSAAEVDDQLKRCKGLADLQAVSRALVLTDAGCS